MHHEANSATLMYAHVDEKSHLHDLLDNSRTQDMLDAHAIIAALGRYSIPKLIQSQNAKSVFPNYAKKGTIHKIGRSRSEYEVYCKVVALWSDLQYSQTKVSVSVLQMQSGNNWKSNQGQKLSTETQSAPLDLFGK